MKKEWKGISEEDIKAEEELARWLYPELDGYEGMLAYISIESIKDKNTVKLKKNILSKKEQIDCIEFNKLLFEFLNEFDYNIRPKVNLLIQGVIQNYYTGVDCLSVRDISKCTNLSKSSIQNVRNKIYKVLSKSDCLHLL
jgi:hypothetical protein